MADVPGMPDMQNPPNMEELMQQAQKMQTKMQAAQEDLVSQKVKGEAGGGIVTLIMNGRHDVESVTIDEDLMDDKEMLEELFAAAVNDAVRRIEKIAQEKMQSLAKDMGLPPGFDGGNA